MTSAFRDGLLRVDKPEGPTSHDVVARARSVLGARKVGHTGTLDPFASGLLLLCLGSSTRLAPYLSSLPKEYLARARLGERTTTDDREGEVIASRPLGSVDVAGVSEALLAYRGEIEQVPPDFSAKKVAGDRAYALARKGEAPVLGSVRVTVHEITLLSAELPFVDFRVLCSTGTYIRALARDVGERLGVGAHLVALRRTAIGPFRVEGAATPDGLTDPEAVLRSRVDPIAAVAHLPRAEIRTAEAEARLRCGQTLAGADLHLETRPVDPLVGAGGGSEVALTRAGALVAIAEWDGDRVHPRKVFPHG